MKLTAILLLAIVLILPTFNFLMDSQCPEDLQVNCVDDVKVAYPICKKAAEAGGSDVIANLKCMKSFNKMKAECWPCICMIAKEEHFHIQGCD